MNTKHTPGPWFIKDGPQYGYNRCTRVESEHGKFGTVICERFTADTNGEVCDEYMTNLRLIAAAPDLLEALERVMRVASVDLFKVRPDLEEQCRAAIAKATQG